MALYEETKNIQQELNDKFITDDPLKYMFSRISLDNQSKLSQGIPLQTTELPVIKGQKDSRNYSRFFGEIYSPTPDLENIAAQRQSGAERLAYITPRIGMKVISEVAQMPGYLGGLVAWGANGFDKDKIGLLVNNAWHRGIQQAEEATKNAIAPVYVSDEVKNGNLFDNIFSSAFWAKEGADGVGFLLSFLVPGQALKAGNIGAKAAKLIKPGTKIGSMATKGLAEGIDLVAATGINTLFESAAEGGETYRNVLDKTGDPNKAGAAAADVVSKNFGILLLSNAVDQYWLFKDINIFKKSAKDLAPNLAKKNVLDQIIDPKTGKKLSEVASRSGWEKAGARTLKFLEGVGKEGFYEEGMQFAASKQAEDEVLNKEEGDQGFLEELIDVGKTYIDNIGDTEMQKSIFLGGLLGGGMSQIAQTREWAAEKRILEGTKATKPSSFAKFFGAKERQETLGLKQLIDRNYLERYSSVADLAKTELDSEGKVIPKLNEDGTYELDSKKVEALALDKLLGHAEKQQLIAFARTGNEEGFAKIKEKMDYRYMAPFIQQEGGINVLMKHIDEIAEKDKEFLEKEGVTVDLDTLKKDLKNKALSFQEVYNRVDSTHDLHMMDLKPVKEDRTIFKEWSDLVRQNKLSEETMTDFADRRISEIRKDLSGYKVPLASSEDNLSEKLLDDLKTQLSDNSKTFTALDKQFINKKLRDLEGHLKDLKVSRTNSSNLYNNTWLKKSFEEYKQVKKEADDSVVDGKKSKEALSLGPKLKALYNKAVAFEDVEYPNKMSFRHSADIEITYLKKEGDTTMPMKIIGQIAGTTNNGNITFKVHKATTNVDGKLKLEDISDNKVHFINEDETINYNGTTYEIAENGVNIVKDVNIVQSERQHEAMLTALKDSIDTQKDLINHTEERISNANDYIDTLMQRLDKLEQQEFDLIKQQGTNLTKQGTSRKIMVMVSRKLGLTKAKMFMTTNELRTEIGKAREGLRSLNNYLNKLEDNYTRLKDQLALAKSMKLEYVKDFQKRLDSLTEITKTSYKTVQDSKSLVDGSEDYLKKMYSILRGDYTVFGKILGITSTLDTIRSNEDLTPEQKDVEIIKVISEFLDTTELTEEQYEAIGTLPQHIQLIADKIAQKEESLNTNTQLLKQNLFRFENLRTTLDLQKLQLKRYSESYAKLAVQLGITENIVDKNVKKMETPEGSIAGLRKSDEKFISEYEVNFKHKFHNWQSWLVSTGDQDQVNLGPQYDYLARWYIFTNKLANKTNKNNQSRYIVRTYTFAQIGELKENDPIRKQVKFFAGYKDKKAVLLTYDEINQISNVNDKVDALQSAKSDIKMVVYTRDNKPLLTSKQVVDKSEDRSYVIYNSFPEAKETTALGYKRFSFKELTDLYKLDKFKTTKDLTKEQIKEADDFVSQEFDKSLVEYANFRNNLINNSHYLDIIAVNPGVKQTDKAEETEVLEGVGTTHVNALDFRIPSPLKSLGEKQYGKSKYGTVVERKHSGVLHGLHSGYLYVGIDNRWERVKPKTFGETNSVDNVVNIIRYLATNPKDYAEVEQYLQTIMYMNYDNPQYRIFFSRYIGADKTKSGFKALVFGQNELTSEQLVKGENLEALKTFLSTKYWNFNSKAFFKSTEFTEYNIIIKGTDILSNTKKWSIAEGGYKGFLFQPIKGNVPKGTIYVKKPAKNAPLDNVRDSQYKNQSVALSVIGTELQELPKPSEKKADKVGKAVDKTGLGFTPISGETSGSFTPEELAKMGMKPIGSPAGTKPKGDASAPQVGVGIQASSAAFSPEELAAMGMKPIGKSSTPLNTNTVPITLNTNTPVGLNKKYSTPDEFWNSKELSEKDKEFFLLNHNNNLEQAQQSAFVSYNSKSNLHRQVTELDNYVQENLNEKIAWFQSKFPQVPIHVASQIVMQNAWGKLSINGRVLLSKTAAEGTVYHEAYHVYDLLFLDEPDRVKLYNEVRKRLGNKDLKDKAISEFLAEEFREFMSDQSTYKFGKSGTLTKSWFTKLLDLILSFLGIENKSEFLVEQSFNKVDLTKEFYISNQLLQSRIAGLKTEYERLSRGIPGFTDKETLDAVQDFNFQFFQVLFDPNSRINPDTIFELDVNLQDIYKQIKANYYFRAKTLSTAQKIFDNFDFVRQQHARFLKQYRIKMPNIAFEENINDLEEVEEGENDVKTSDEFRDSLSINMAEKIDNPIRLLIAGLPDVINDHGLIRANLSEFGTNSTVKYFRRINVLMDNLSKINSFDGMVEKMKTLIPVYPDIYYLLTRLGIDMNNSNVKPTNSQMQLQNQFFRNFSHNKNIPLLLNVDDKGKMFLQNAVDTNTQKLIRNEWLNNARLIAGQPKAFIYKNKSGNFTIDAKKLKEQLILWKNIAENKRIDKSIEILKGLGIIISPTVQITYDYKLINDYLDRLGQELDKTKDRPMMIQELYNEDLIQNQVEMRRLIEYSSNFYLNDSDLSYFNQDTNREYSITLNSHLSNTVNALNNISVDFKEGTISIPEDVQHLMKWDGNTGNLLNRHSVWLDLLLNNQKLKLHLLKGNILPSKEQNKEISKMEFGDYKAMTFNALLKGIVPFLRSADRKLEYALSIGTPNYNITDDTFKKTMLGYLQDELATSFARLLDPENWGGDLINYSENVKKLRVFSFLHNNPKLQSLEDFVLLNKNENFDNTVNEADRLVSLFLKNNKKLIDKEFDNYLEDLEKTTLESLKEDNIIVEEVATAGYVFAVYIPGIDTEILKDFNIEPNNPRGFISTDQIKRLVRVANYNQFVGANEQLRLVLGDLANFKDAGDFHKRTTGATSTKYDLRDDQDIRDFMDQSFRRFDGKQRTDSMTIVPVDDIISSNSELSKIFSDYKKIKGTDAQSWATLDEIRDIWIRHGNWYPRHEKTYQWEMQKLVLRLLKLQEAGRKLPLEVSEEMFTDPNGIFYNHTKGTVPTVPMYNGKELSLDQLGPLTIIKPQGFGHIADINGLYATEFFKTSTAPIFMSAIEDTSPMFDFLLSMIANQQSILTFGTAMKGTMKGTEVGKAQQLMDKDGNINPELVAQELRYKDFGIQLDIHEENESGRVTVSTQRTRLEFNNLFNLGELVSSEQLGKNRNEYTTITNSIYKQLRDNLISELGISYNETTNKFELLDNNKDKFKERLIKAFETRYMEYNIIDGLDFALDTPLQVFDVTINKFKIEEVLTAMVRNDIIRRQVSGDMLIQESSFLYDADLKFYEPGKAMEVIISIPKNLIQFIEDKGGLDVVNKAIAENNVKLLGKDFFKLLTIPANRIPAQSLSSIDIVKIKKFVPHYHGSKIIIPAEQVIKAGSDFDVDKLTTYFSNFSYKDGVLTYNTDLETIGGKQNRLNELAIESLLDESRFKELIEPLSGEYFKKKATTAKSKRVYKNWTDIRNTSNQFSDVINWWYNMQKGFEFWNSKSSVAIAAVQTAAHAVEQNHPLELHPSNPLPILFKGQELEAGEVYRSGFIKDIDGKKISDNFARFMTAFVDASKDPFIFEITDNRTFNAIAALNRFGKNSSVGVDQLIAFYTQDIVKDSLNLRRANQASYMTFNQYNDARKTRAPKWSKARKLKEADQYNKLVADLKASIGADVTTLPLNYENTVAAAFKNYLYAYNEDKKAEALKAIKDRISTYNYVHLSEQDLEDIKTFNQNKDKYSKEEKNKFFKLQVQVLDNFLMYDQFGWAMVRVNSMLRPDAASSFNRHLSAIITSTTIPFDVVESQRLFNINSIEQAIIGSEENPSLLTQAFYTKKMTPEIYEWSSLIAKAPIIKDFFENQVYPKLGRRKGMTVKKLDSTLGVVEADFITFLVTQFFGPISQEELNQNYSLLMQGDESMAKQLLRMKYLIPNNMALQELEPIIAERRHRTRTISEIDNISLFNKNFDTNEWNALESSFYDLAKSNRENESFATKLILQSVFQSGFHNSPISFMRLISNRIAVPMFEGAIRTFINQDEATQKTQLASFYEQLFMNNANNPDLVPKMKFRLSNDVGAVKHYVDQKDFYHGIDYFSVNYFMDDVRKYVTKGFAPPMGLALMKRVPGTNEFVLWPKLGDSIKLKEYYPMVPANEVYNIKSILDLNRYVAIPTDVMISAEELKALPFEVPQPTEDETEDAEGLYFTPPPVKPVPTTPKKNRKLKGSEEKVGEPELSEKNEYAKSLGSDTTIQRVLTQIVNKSTSSSNKALATTLLNVLPRVPIHVQIFDKKYKDETYSITGKSYRGFTEYNEGDHSTKNIGLYENLSKDQFEETTLHEAIHALTMQRYKTDLVFQNKINQLFDYSRSYIRNFENIDLLLSNVKNVDDVLDLDHNIFTDQYEFMSEALANESFQQILSMVPAFDESNIKDLSRSAFAQFIDSIFELLKSFFVKNPSIAKEVPRNVFKEIVSVIDDTLVKSEEVNELDLDENSDPRTLAVARSQFPSTYERQYVGKINNENELNKDNEITEFEKLYPEYAHLSLEEQTTFKDAIDKGELHLVCGI